MFSLQELSFAQKYPFTRTASAIVRKSNFALQDVPREVRERAKAMMGAAMGKMQYLPIVTSSQELLLSEVLAYPLARIFVSAVSSDDLCRKFARMVSENCFEHLNSAEKSSVLLDLASELGIGFELEDDFFASVSLFDYLRASFRQQDDFMKPVNQRLEKGRVYLNRNDFARFLSGAAFEAVYSSLPVDVKSVPRYLLDEAKSFHGEKVSRASHDALFSGGISVLEPDCLPPCFAEIYAKLASGASVPHLARFDLAAFLASLGVPKEKIKELFKGAPNYDEKKTSYHVEKLFSGGKPSYGPPSCLKMREHGICLSQDCGVTNPIIYYRRCAKRKSNEK